MTCHTDDAEIEKAYLHFVEHIEPETKPREFKLAQLFVAHPLRNQLPRPRYEVFDRATALQVELFRPENVPLETEEAKLGQQYQKLCGALTVEYGGKERRLCKWRVTWRNQTARSGRRPGNWWRTGDCSEVEAIENIMDRTHQAARTNRPERRVQELRGLCLSQPAAV